MIVLDSLKSLRIKLAGAPATTQPSWLSCWRDGRPWSTPASLTGAANGTTYVPIVAAPAAGTREVSDFFIRNRDTAAVVLTIECLDNAVPIELWKITLDPDDTLEYSGGNTVTVNDATGAQKGAGTGGGGSGTVTSVALTVPAFLSVAGSPVTTTGTLAVTLATQSANLIWAGPTTGSAAAPTFRAMVAADLVAHKTTHQSGGADAIKLDDLSAPDDNTDLDASTSAHGLLKKLPGGTTTFLRADGSFTTPPGTGTYTDEEAQDAIGTILTDSASIDLTYTDATPAITAAVIPGGIKLDDFGAPDDNTDLDASTSAHGLLKKLPGGTTTFLRADGSFATPSGSGGAVAQDFIDAAWQKKFFSDASVLPATERLTASLTTIPTELGTFGTGTPVFTKDTGHARLTGTNSTTSWDLLALRSTVLVVCAGRMFGGAVQMSFSLHASAPNATFNDGYYVWAETAGGGVGLHISKYASSTFTTLGTVAPNLVPGSPANDMISIGMALYYDDATGALKYFARFGGGGWFLVASTTDSTYTTVRYVGVHSGAAGAHTGRMICPFTAWSE